MTANYGPLGTGRRGNLLASGVAFLSASIWGLFWLPLREIDAQGLSGPWTVVVINLFPLLFFLPVAIARRKSISENFRSLAILSALMSAGLIFYMLGLVYTSIMRATLLFYMTPVWSTLFAIVLLSERVIWQRWAAIVIGFAGLFLMLSAKGSAGGSLNIGDVMGFAAGIFWGAGAAYSRLRDDLPPADTSACIFFISFVLALVLIWPLSEGPLAVPEWSAWLAATPVAAAFSILIFLPTLYIIIWCTQHLSPGRVGILMMSEVLVAAISAPVLAGELLTAQEWIGGILIVGAGVLEVLSPEPAAAEART
ncbi:MAG: DMT family transporter [Pseudomonadota bacterium]